MGNQIPGNDVDGCYWECTDEEIKNFCEHKWGPQYDKQFGDTIKECSKTCGALDWGCYAEKLGLATLKKCNYPDKSNWLDENCVQVVKNMEQRCTWSGWTQEKCKGPY